MANVFPPADFPPDELDTLLWQVRQAADPLAHAIPAQRTQALMAMGQALQKHQDTILEANTLDLEISREMAVPDRVVDWLKLTPERLQMAMQILQRLAALGEPLNPPSLLEAWGSLGYHPRPLGIVALVYEAFPDLAAIAAGLCVRTGNALVLHGGYEASQTNQVIGEVLQAAIVSVGLPEDSLMTLSPNQTEHLRRRLAQHAEIDLLIPYGRPSLIDQMVQQATVPVIPTRIGNCYLYWSASGSLETAYQMIVESHEGLPDAVNRIEKVIFHDSHSESSLTRLWKRLQEQGFELRGDANLAEQFRQLNPIEQTSEWRTPYLARTVAFRPADSLETAVLWMNRHSSGHADGIATDTYGESRQFMAWSRSASLYVNASPKFTRNPPAVSGIALGMSNQPRPWGGLINLSSLTAQQCVWQGDLS